MMLKRLRILAAVSIFPVAIGSGLTIAETPVDAGDKLYRQCAACHLDDGAGVIGAFPPIRNRVSRFAETDSGREYLASVLLKGLNGPISVGEQNYSGFMQAYGPIFNDLQISQVLNYVAENLSDDQTQTPQKFSEQEIAELRKRLSASKATSLELRGSLSVD